MPELGHILDEPPPLPDVGPVEAKNRFRYTVQYFVRMTASAEHPLVLFIDDLQWADPASMAFLQDILTAPEVSHLLVLGAYRDNEVDAEHAVHALRKTVKESGREMQVTVLEPLGGAALSGMVADMFDRPIEEVEALAAVTKEKTDGSPFFVEQFLRALHERRLLARDFESGAWRWDAAQIERSAVTDNVADLLAHKMRGLSTIAQRLLSVGACIGARFDARLVGASEKMAEEVLRAGLAESVHEGLVVPVGEEDAEAYEFVHDRVQQAAYEALAEEERAKTHHALAVAIERLSGEAAADAELFAMLHHHHRALNWLATLEEKHHVAELCLRGGQRAKAGSAYAEAARLLRAGKELLGSEGWDAAPGCTFETHLALGEAEWLGGRPEAGGKLFGMCAERASD